MQVELFGLPACGKTTLVEALSPLMHASGRKMLVPLPRQPSTVRQRGEKAIRDWSAIGRMACGTLDGATAIWHACRRFEQPTTSQQIRLFLGCLRLEGLTRNYRELAREGEIIMFDQGLFQAIWSLALGSRTGDVTKLEQAATDLLKCMTMPDLVVLIDTPPAEVRRRLKLGPRGHGRLGNLIRQDPIWMDQASARLHLIWSVCRHQPDIRTYRVSQVGPDLPALAHLLGSSRNPTRLMQEAEPVCANAASASKVHNR